MKTFAPELIEKAKALNTVEELLALAKESGIEMTQQEATGYFAQLHPVSGELSDDELDDVAGGGCSGTTDDGKKYTVVSSGLQCYNGLYKRGAEAKADTTIITYRDNVKNNTGLRNLWATMACNASGVCGTCLYLCFDGSTGYCYYSQK